MNPPTPGPGDSPGTLPGGVLRLDTRLGGWERVTAAYLVPGPAPVLVETGAQASVAALLDALAVAGVGPGDLAAVVVTHVHLDHAGGAGTVAAAFPEATVWVHERGARHLADPSRLVASAERVFGDLLDTLYGRPAPVPGDRLAVAAGGGVVDVGGGRRLEVIDSPGHAGHHLALLDSGSGLLFSGDAAGVLLPDIGVLRPATPPPEFDLDAALGSLSRFAERRPAGLCLAHFGLVSDPAETLAEAGDALRRWAEVAERAWRGGADVAAALDAAFGAELDGAPGEHRRRLEMLNGVHANAAGLRRWLEQHGGPPSRP